MMCPRPDFQSIHCSSRSNLKTLILSLKKLFYFEYAVCARGNVIELLQARGVPRLDVINVNYPDGYMELYMKNKVYSKDAIFNEFATNLSPVNWARVDKNATISTWRPFMPWIST